MISVLELKNENMEIEHVRKVLAALVGNVEMHTNFIFCELLERFQSMLNNHLKHEARSMYPALLSSKDRETNMIAKHFLDNTHELERLLDKYVKHWCHKLEGRDVDKFIKETEEVFMLVDKRIELEEKHLFPVLS
ncbi:MAG: hemerythrin domain-containing protein [Gammaproteobacteria bacterium]|nr:hemerythrin domain-containing protein [Gammaproteobacteria bacterium]